ncbi:helix-turn-helix domain-containing protein [Senegalimassilia anaerobia]|uniref:helix-turn-helix domain-containing protein n=1 Tax=Senegalimassilia anaerobia TaxID=1473216 RepID=UPI0026717C7C|nr:helix-turn-helix domain-containing protein [Senegalimassilia anaerobia]
MGSSFARNLTAFLDSRDLTQESFGRMIGKSQGAVSQWLAGNREPASTTLNKICEVFGLERDDFISERAGFYAKLHGLTDAPAGAIAAKPSSALVPLLGTTHMGEFEDEGECDRMVEVPASVAEAHPGGFCVRADGECMNNRYPSDSVLFVDPNMQPFDGCAVLAETQDFQSIVRKYSRGASALMLSPDSHGCEFEDIIVRADDAPIMLKGVVVWYQAEKDVR